MAIQWSGWASLGKPAETELGRPFVQRNQDGRLEVFCPGNGAFCNRWQESPGSSVWRHEGWNAKPSPGEGVGIVWLDAALNFTNHLEVFALADDGALWHAWQVDTAPFWSKWESLGSPPAGIREADRLTIGTNQDGRLEVFVADQNGAVWHTWQIRHSSDYVPEIGHLFFTPPVWILTPVGDAYTIQLKRSGRFMDAHEIAEKDVAIVARPDQNDDTQRWLIRSLGNNTFTIQQKMWIIESAASSPAHTPSKSG